MKYLNIGLIFGILSVHLYFLASNRNALISTVHVHVDALMYTCLDVFAT